MLVSKDRLFCFSFFLVLKSLLWKLKETAPRKVERQPEYGSIYKLTGSSTKMLILYYLNIYMGWKQRKMSPFTSSRWFHFPVLFIKKVMLLNQMRSTEQVEGSTESSFAQHLLDMNAKPFCLGNWTKAEHGALAHIHRVLFFLSGDHPTNSSHRSR